MTALGSQDVKRTFSDTRRDLTGLPGAKTHEAVGKNMGELI
jgi:hypothetical protein